MHWMKEWTVLPAKFLAMRRSNGLAQFPKKFAPQKALSIFETLGGIVEKQTSVSIYIDIY
jgi:hypothetical protein